MELADGRSRTDTAIRRRRVRAAVRSSRSPVRAAYQRGIQPHALRLPGGAYRGLWRLPCADALCGHRTSGARRRSVVAPGGDEHSLEPQAWRSALGAAGRSRSAAQLRLPPFAGADGCARRAGRDGAGAAAAGARTGRWLHRKGRGGPGPRSRRAAHRNRHLADDRPARGGLAALRVRTPQHGAPADRSRRGHAPGQRALRLDPAGVSRCHRKAAPRAGAGKDYRPLAGGPDRRFERGAAARGMGDDRHSDQLRRRRARIRLSRCLAAPGFT